MMLMTVLLVKPAPAAAADAKLDSSLSTLEPDELRAVYTLGDSRNLRRLPSATRRMARLFDGRRTVMQICAAAGVSITRGLRLVDRLARLDLLVAVSRKRARAARRSVQRIVEAIGFSETEEAFFASEVQAEDLGEDYSPRASDAAPSAFRQVAEKVFDWFGLGSPSDERVTGRQRARVAPRVGATSSLT